MAVNYEFEKKSVKKTDEDDRRDCNFEKDWVWLMAGKSKEEH